MTEYIRLVDQQYPLTEYDIRLAHPNTSFPALFEPPEGYAVVFPTPMPAHDTVIQQARKVAPELTDRGWWEQRWEVVSRFVEYTDEQGVTHTVAEQEAAAIADAAAQAQQRRLDEFERALTNHLDAVAQARRYQNRITCAVRAGYPGPFQAEGVAFAQWMDACNALAYGWLGEVLAGTRPMPDSTQELIDALPAMVWPDPA